MRIVDVLFSPETEISDYNTLFQKHGASMGHHALLAEKTELYVIRHFNGAGQLKIGNVEYHFFKRSASKFWLPFRLARFVRSLKPDIIIAHGFFNPLQLFILKLYSRAKIILQYHGGGLPGGLTGLLQIQVNKWISAYIFTSSCQADPFIKNGFIPRGSNIFEVMEGSNDFTKTDKATVKKQLRVAAQFVFLWVGSLNYNKDPLTVLEAFEQLLQNGHSLELYMIYVDDQLLPQVKTKINNSETLKDFVHLMGKVSREMIEVYFNCADFFVLGSHYESCGYALAEAMACGCIPIVTDIPSFRTMTDDGKLGALWECGNKDSLVNAASRAMQKPLQQESENCTRFFNKELSFKAIAEDLYEICKKLAAEKS